MDDLDSFLGAGPAAPEGDEIDSFLGPPQKPTPVTKSVTPVEEFAKAPSRQLPIMATADQELYEPTPITQDPLLKIAEPVEKLMRSPGAQAAVEAGAAAAGVPSVGAVIPPAATAVARTAEGLSTPENLAILPAIAVAPAEVAARSVCTSRVR